MPQFEVEVEITKSYVNTKNIKVYAKDEDEAEEKARDIALSWGAGNADDVDISVCGATEI